MSESHTLKKLCIYWHSDKPVTSMTSWTVSELEAEWQRWRHIVAGDPNFMACPQFDRIYLKNVFQRVGQPHLLMEWCHFFAKPGALFASETPYGSHDTADEDLDAQRRIFKDTYRAFEPNWHFRRRVFYCDGLFFEPGVTEMQIAMAVANMRNVCKSLAVELVCQKPVPEGYRPADPTSIWQFI